MSRAPRVALTRFRAHPLSRSPHSSAVPSLLDRPRKACVLIALDLLTGKTDEPKQTKDVNVALVPLGMPLLAGPGAIVAVILAVQKADGAAAQVSVWTAILATTWCCGWSCAIRC